MHKLFAQIGSKLIFMAIDRAHRLIMGKCCSDDSNFIFLSDLHQTCKKTKMVIKSGTRFRFRGRLDYSLWRYSTLSDEKFSHKTCNGENVVLRIAPSLLIESSSNLQVTRTAIKSRTSSNSGKIGLFTLELLALECKKKTPTFDCQDHSLCNFMKLADK